MLRSFGRLALIALVATGLLGTVWFGRPSPLDAQAPPLSSEELLGHVLPAGSGGGRPGVIAWARYDGVTPAGSPDILVALLYETPAPFGTTEVRRLVNRVVWNGRAYEAARKDDPGEVLSGDAARLGRPTWSVSIDLSLRQTDAGLMYVATYAGSGPLDHGGPGTLTLTELLSPDSSLLWRRITELSERRAAGVEPSQAISVAYRVERAGNGPDRLIATVAETRTLGGDAPGAMPAVQLERFEEVYVREGGGFRLVTRSILLQP